MAINITSNYTSNQVNLLQKFHNNYQKNIDEKVALPQNEPKESIIAQKTDSHKLQEYLSVDEKKVLKEVFGDLNVEKNVYNPYNGTRFAYIFKGSQLDVKL